MQIIVFVQLVDVICVESRRAQLVQLQFPKHSKHLIELCDQVCAVFDFVRTASKPCSCSIISLFVRACAFTLAIQKRDGMSTGHISGVPKPARKQQLQEWRPCSLVAHPNALVDQVHGRHRPTGLEQNELDRCSGTVRRQPKHSHRRKNASQRRNIRTRKQWRHRRFMEPPGWLGLLTQKLFALGSPNSDSIVRLFHRFTQSPTMIICHDTRTRTTQPWPGKAGVSATSKTCLVKWRICRAY